MSTLILDTSTRWGVHDIETTGLTDADRIVQFGCCFFQGRHKQDAVDLLLDPGIPIPEPVSQLHGITTEMVAGKPTMAQAGRTIYEALADRQMAVAFNGRRFDDQWLVRELASAGIEYRPKPLVDVFDFLWYFRRDAAEDGKGHKLTDWAERTGLPAFDAHSAVVDCAATGLLLIWAIDQGIIPETIEDACEVGEVVGKYIDREKEIYGGAFYLDRSESPVLRMGFGKHRGIPAKSVPASYYRWLIDKSDQPNHVKQLAISILRGQQIQPHEDLMMLRESIAVARMRATTRKDQEQRKDPVIAEVSTQAESEPGVATCPVCKTEFSDTRLLIVDSTGQTVEPATWSQLCRTCRDDLRSQNGTTALCWRCEHRVESNAQRLIKQPSAGPMMACDVGNPRQLEEVDACPQFVALTPESLAVLKGNLGLTEMWGVQSDPDTLLLCLMTNKPVGAVDDADAVLPQEQAARYAMALDGVEAITADGKYVQLSTFVDTALPEGELTMDEVEIPLRSAMTRFVAEFFGSRADWLVKRGRFNRLTVTLKIRESIPEGLLRMTARCMSSLLCEVAESLDTPWAACVPFADVRVISVDFAVAFGLPAVPHVNGNKWSDVSQFEKQWPIAEETVVKSENPAPALLIGEPTARKTTDSPLPDGTVYRVILDGKTIAFELAARLELLRPDYSPDVVFQQLTEDECKVINLSLTKLVGELLEGEKQETVSLAKVAEAAKQTLSWRKQGQVELFQWVTGINDAVPLDR